MLTSAAESSVARVLQEPGGPRSPTVFGAIVSYIEQFFETVGISLANRQVRPLLNTYFWNYVGTVDFFLQKWSL
jgi:hypothetical protein